MHHTELHNRSIHSNKVTKIIAISSTIAHSPTIKNVPIPKFRPLQTNTLTFTIKFTSNYFQLPMVFINFALNIHKTTIT